MDEPVGRALCMGAYDPQSSSAAGGVLSGVKAAAAKQKLPRVDLAKKVAENTSLQSEVDECDMDDPVGRALCMGAYDPQSSSSAGWVLSGVKAAAAKQKLPRVDLAKKVAENTSLQSEVDECDMDDPV